MPATKDRIGATKSVLPKVIRKRINVSIVTKNKPIIQYNLFDGKSR
jgi:hypothetical protein